MDTVLSSEQNYQKVIHWCLFIFGYFCKTFCFYYLKIFHIISLQTFTQLRRKAARFESSQYEIIVAYWDFEMMFDSNTNCVTIETTEQEIADEYFDNLILNITNNGPIHPPYTNIYIES